MTKNRNLTIIQGDEMTEEQKNLANFADDNVLIVDNSVDMSKESFFDDDEEEYDIFKAAAQQSEGDNNEPELDENGNPITPANNNQNPVNGGDPGDDPSKPDGDISEEELMKQFDVAGDNKPAAVPTEFNSPVEVAKYLGVTLSKEPEKVTFEDVKTEIENIRKIATEDSLTEVKNIKTFLAENPGAKEIDYFTKYISPVEPLLLYDDKQLAVWMYTEVNKMKREDAEKKVDDMVYDNTFAEEAKKLRNIVIEKNNQFYKDRDAKIEEQAKAKEVEKIEKKKALMSSILKSKESFIGGEIVLKNTDVKNLYDKIVSGEVHKQLKNHNVIAEVAWFLDNKESLISILKGDASEETKLKIWNKMSNAKQQTAPKGNPPSSAPAGIIDPNDWTD